MNVSRAHLLAALRFLDGPDGGGSGGTPPGTGDTPPAGGEGGTGGDNGDRGTGDEGEDPDADKPDHRQARRDENTRARLKEAEAAREALAARVEAYQRREVLRIAGGVLAAAEDLFTVGNLKLEDVLGEDGEIDEDEVLGMAAALVDQRPGLTKGARLPARGGHPDWGHSRANTVGMGGGKPSWGEALIRREGSAGR